MKHGHGGYTNHGCRCEVCTEATAEYQRAYQAKYRQENKEKKRAAYKIYSAQHHQELREKARSPHGKALGRKKQAQRKAREWAQFVENVDRHVVYERHGGVCALCGGDVPAESFNIDHIVPLVHGGPHSYANVQLTHPRCNRAKGF